MPIIAHVAIEFDVSIFNPGCALNYNNIKALQ